jgi:hypothetical protein
MRTEHYHPSLNSAVFDGPLRIYFVQSQESLALNLYFQLQKILEKYGFDQQNPDWYFVVLIYPTSEIFDTQTQAKGLSFQLLNFGADKLILTHGELGETGFSSLVNSLNSFLDQSCRLHEPQNIFAI